MAVGFLGVLCLKEGGSLQADGHFKAAGPAQQLVLLYIYNALLLRLSAALGSRKLPELLLHLVAAECPQLRCLSSPSDYPHHISGTRRLEGQGDIPHKPCSHWEHYCPKKHIGPHLLHTACSACATRKTMLVTQASLSLKAASYMLVFASFHSKCVGMSRMTSADDCLWTSQADQPWAGSTPSRLGLRDSR